ncbi:MAG: Mu transposase C-terminal domain-containing protein [Xanthobacteraceae bacterium]
MMNNTAAQNNAARSISAVPCFRLDPTDKVVIDGVEYAPKSSNDVGHILRRVDNLDMCESFTHAEIESYRQEGQSDPQKWRHCRGFFLASKAQLRIARPETHLADLPPKLREKVLFRKKFCDEFLKMEADGFATRSDASMKAAVTTILSSDLVSKLEDGRCGSDDVNLKRPPSPRALRRWLAYYSACDWDAMALADNYGRSGNRNPRFGTEERMLMQKYAEMYASRLQPSKTSLFKLLRKEISDQNEKLKAAGRRLLQLPSRTAFERVIDKLDPFHVYAGRHSPEAARKKFFVTNRGLSVTRPLERVELDENLVPLQTLLTNARLWRHLTPKQKSEVERRRLWLSTAIDTATRCVLAALLVENPSAESAVATLEMAVNDKTAYAEAAGCVTPWDNFGTGETYGSDAGAGYKSNQYRSSVSDLGAEALFPTTGLPQMRGRQERFYRSLHEGLFAKFHGRTFENPVAKGNYEAELNAVIDPSELGRMIVRWIVDVYHNTPHSGLGNETPRNAWLRLNKIFPVMPPPDAEINRHIFGLTTTVRIGNRGVRFLGHHYQSSELQRIRRVVRSKPVNIRVDRNNIGHVSVRSDTATSADTGWITVPCVTPGYDNVSVEHWIRTASVLRQQNADMAKLAEPVVQQALREIQEFSQAATRRANIAWPVLSPTDYEHVNRDLFRNFDFIRTDGGAPAILDAPADDIAANDAPSIGSRSVEAAPDGSADDNWFTED